MGTLLLKNSRICGTPILGREYLKHTFSLQGALGGYWEAFKRDGWEYIGWLSAGYVTGGYKFDGNIVQYDWPFTYDIMFLLYTYYIM